MKKPTVWLVAAVCALLCSQVEAGGANSLRAKGDLKIGRSRPIAEEAVTSIGTKLRRRGSATSRQVSTPSGKALPRPRALLGTVDWDDARASTLDWAIARDDASGTPISSATYQRRRRGNGHSAQPDRRLNSPWK